jgi:hypothetical protein
MIWQQCDWSQQAHEVLKPALNGDDDHIKQEVQKGLSSLFKCDAGYMVVRREDDELVLVSGAGRNVDEALQDWIAAAKQQGFKSVRYHTQRKGMMRKAKNNGFKELERVYRLEL